MNSATAKLLNHYSAAAKKSPRAIRRAYLALDHRERAAVKRKCRRALAEFAPMLKAQKAGLVLPEGTVPQLEAMARAQAPAAAPAKPRRSPADLLKAAVERRFKKRDSGVLVPR